MITFIATGHGNFGTGLASSVKLIAGDQEAFAPIDFDGQIGQEELSKIYLDAINAAGNKDVLFCTDLIGGTPFKTACEFKYAHPELNVEVISGTNLGLLIEGLMSRAFSEDLKALADQLVNTGKEQVIRFELPKKVEEVDSGDGI